ncbi:MAG TPA: type II toxin-antitoxin system death-on-curing family toxin [Phycisphaerae bacterium]|nr:type II toxin-antitoxin system death-on-curing family toxin [Phycisphaerae bacterium]
MTDPTWIRDDVVLAVHRRQLQEHGGVDGIRDPGLLSSALARPKNFLAYSRANCDIARLAAAYAFGIARNHPFLDGNKRTAFVVCVTFLQVNGFNLSAEPEEKYKAFLQLAEGKLSEEEFALWIREHTVRRRS